MFIPEKILVHLTGKAKEINSVLLVEHLGRGDKERATLTVGEGNYYSSRCSAATYATIAGWGKINLHNSMTG